MSNELSEFHDELRAVARSVFASDGPLGAPDWAQVVQAGFTGLEIDEAFDGAGATFAETAVVLEEAGRAAARTPLLGSVLATVVADAELHRAIAGGARVAVVSGSSEFVIDAPNAEVMVVVEGDTVSVLEGWVVRPQPVLDETRSLGVVSLDGASVLRTWTVPGAASLVADRGALAVAIDSLGLSEAMTDATVEYAKVREQFGRPIGSFQAVKHACADMAVKNAVARALVSNAVASARSADISMAKAYATAAAVDVVGKAMQLHGGIGYTWESGVHAYLKRATLNRSLFGSPAHHRRALSQRYLETAH